MTPDQMIMLGGGAIFMLIVLYVIFGGGDDAAAVEKRLDRVGGMKPIKTIQEVNTGALLKKNSDSSIAFIDFLIKHTLPNPDKMRLRLAATGKNISIGEYCMINVLAILVAYLVFAYVVHWIRPVAFFMGIAVGLYLPHMITGRMGRKRIMKFLGTFPEAIDTICRGLRSGLPITETIATVGHELPDPIGIEFTRISDGVRMGRSLEESMWEVSKRLDTPEYRFFIIALAIQRETGGNLAETLGNLADLLRKRRQLKLKIRAMSSEARASAMIIGSLPFLMFALLYFVNTEYIMILLNDIRGKIMLAGGLGWLSIGVMVMKQMINFEI